MCVFAQITDCSSDRRPGGSQADRGRIAWSVLDLTLPSAAENLALDEALLVGQEEEERVGFGRPTLRFWELPDFAVVMGASSRRLIEVNVEACRLDGVRLSRRSSGGGTVVIGPGSLNLTVVLPLPFAAELSAVDSAQRFVLERHAMALSRLGSRVEVLGLGDLTIEGRKFAGSAQRRLKENVLIHVSIMRTGFDLDRVIRYLPRPPKEPSYRAGRSHQDFLTTINASRESLIEALSEDWVGEHLAIQGAYSQGLVEKLLADRFGDLDWVERF